MFEPVRTIFSTRLAYPKTLFSRYRGYSMYQVYDIFHRNREPTNFNLAIICPCPFHLLLLLYVPVQCAVCSMDYTVHTVCNMQQQLCNFKLCADDIISAKQQILSVIQRSYYSRRI